MIVRTKVKMQWVQPQTCSCRRSRNSALQNATSYKIACTRLLMRVTITTTNQILWISFLCFFSFSWCFFVVAAVVVVMHYFRCNAMLHIPTTMYERVCTQHLVSPMSGVNFCLLVNISRVCFCCCFCVLSSLFLFYHHMNDDDNHLRSSLRLFEFFGRKKIVTFCIS